MEGRSGRTRQYPPQQRHWEAAQEGQREETLQEYAHSERPKIRAVPKKRATPKIRNTCGFPQSVSKVRTTCIIHINRALTLNRKNPKKKKAPPLRLLPGYHR